MNIRGATCILLVALFGASGAWAKDIEYDVKAAFIYNFAKFVKWPEGTSKITFCIVGKNPFGASTDGVDGKPVADKTFKVALTGALNAACNIVFIAESERGRLASTLESIKGDGVLTVADTEGFAARGVMINFFIDEEGRVRFEVNNEAMKKGGVIIGSQLLKLGKVVNGAGVRQ